MSEIKDRSAAFPRFVPDGHYNGSIDEEGMLLRDYFAAKALSACVESCINDTRNPGETQAQLIARRAYELADAMLKERDK